MSQHLRSSRRPVIRHQMTFREGCRYRSLIRPPSSSRRLTWLARAVAGLHRGRGGEIRTQARDLSRCSAPETARAGVTLVPQGRRLLGSLTVAQHLAVTRLHRRPRALPVDELLDLFPQLRERLGVRARALSGGEQQMLAIARTVMDEPTEGLAPAVVRLIGALVARLRDDGVSVLLMDQHGAFPPAVADEVVEMERGVIARQ